jgi:hypothetical protein
VSLIHHDRGITPFLFLRIVPQTSGTVTTVRELSSAGIEIGPSSDVQRDPEPVGSEPGPSVQPSNSGEADHQPGAGAFAGRTCEEAGVAYPLDESGHLCFGGFAKLAQRQDVMKYSEYFLVP